MSWRCYDVNFVEGGLGIGLRPSRQRRKLSFSGSMQRMRVAVNVQTLNSMVTSPLHISKEKLQRLGSKALFRKEKSSGMTYIHPLVICFSSSSTRRETDLFYLLKSFVLPHCYCHCYRRRLSVSPAARGPDNGPAFAGRCEGRRRTQSPVGAEDARHRSRGRRRRR